MGWFLEHFHRPPIVSFRTDGQLMLTGVLSYGTAGFLKGDVQEQRQEAKAAIILINDAKRSKGYFLQDATRMIRDHFQDNSITEKEVAESIKRHDSKMTYCKAGKVMGLAGILMHGGKDIIAERALNKHSKINTNQRGIVKKIPANDSLSSEDSGQGGIVQ